MLIYLNIITDKVKSSLFRLGFTSFSWLGMILLTELSRRRIRSINKLIRVGRNEVVVVVRVDRDKGLISINTKKNYFQSIF